MVQCFFNCNLGGILHDPVEIFFTDTVNGCIRSGIAKVDSIGHAIFHREFHRVEVIPEGMIQLKDPVVHFFHDRIFQIGSLADITQMMSIAWLV